MAELRSVSRLRARRRRRPAARKSPSSAIRSRTPATSSSATSCASAAPSTSAIRRMDAKATSALLVEAFGDIGLETLAGRHPAWVTIARNFLVEIGPPPVRPDRAVLQIKAYQRPRRPARRSSRSSRAPATRSRWTSRRRADRQRRGADVAVLDRQGRRLAGRARGPARASCASPQAAGRAARRHRRRRPRRLRALQGARLHLLPGRVLRPAADLQAPRRRAPPASARCAASPS